MPLFITLKNRVQFAVHGEKLELSDWRGKKLRTAKAMNGHDLAVLTSEVCIVEHIPMDVYLKRQEDARKEAEKQRAGSNRRITGPM